MEMLEKPINLEKMETPEALREKFKKFVLSEESLFGFNILIDDFDCTKTRKLYDLRRKC